MKIVIATPLYPPEIAEPAPYVKQLATRLSKVHSVVIVAYVRFPEKVPGVRIVAVDKHRARLSRLISYFFALWEATSDADILYCENGASVELPVIILSFLRRRQLIIHVGDIAAYAASRKSLLLRSIQRLAFTRAREVIRDMPLPRPEQLPLEPHPAEDMEAYEHSWENHLRSLADTFNHGS